MSTPALPRCSGTLPMRSWAGPLSILSPVKIIRIMQKICSTGAWVPARGTRGGFAGKTGLPSGAWYLHPLSWISLTIALDDLEIYADHLLGKVFYNLMDNTLRYGETVSEITVSCERRAGGLMVLALMRKPGSIYLNGVLENIPCSASFSQNKCSASPGSPLPKPVPRERAPDLRLPCRKGSTVFPAHPSGNPNP